jgi:hypothetical protein
VDLGSHLHTLADNSMYTFIETKVTLANAVEQVTISTIAATEAASAAATSASAASSSATAAQTAAESVAAEAAVLATDLNTHIDNVNAHSQYHRKDAIANDSDALWCGTAGGTANSLTLSLPGTPVPQVYPAYKDGTRFTFKASANNTLAVTVNIGGLGVKNVTKAGGTPLTASDIKAGDVYEIVYDGSNFQISGSLVVNAYTIAEVNELMLMGRDAVVRYVSTTQVKLSCHGGRKLCINGRNENIPSGGITVSNSGLSADTLYYLYAYMSGDSMAVEAVPTLYDIDSTTGAASKFGDQTRALLGC